MNPNFFFFSFFSWGGGWRGGAGERGARVSDIFRKDLNLLKMYIFWGVRLRDGGGGGVGRG